MRNEEGIKSVLKRMVKFCDDISNILENHNYNKSEFEVNAEFQYSCGMCILQIGELTSRLPDDFKYRNSEIPWQAIKAMRNIYAHDYEGLSEEIVWNTLTDRIPELKDGLYKLIEKISDSK